MTSQSKFRANEMVTPQRLLLARRRKKVTAKALADSLGISTAYLSRFETGKVAFPEELLPKASKFLGVPIPFFFGPELEHLPSEAATFRSLARMTAASRDSATTAAAFAFSLSDWLERNYNLPAWEEVSVPGEPDPVAAARELRAYWGLGEKPVSDIIRLLEAKGVRVFSLSEQDLSVDAYSCWRNNRPYIFLNTIKSGEHTVFDAAHELGHIILHKHGASHKGVEHEANTFASEFLMPSRDVRAEIPRVQSLQQLIVKKRRWSVSLAALVYRLRRVGKLTDARYRSLYIQIGKKGYRTEEPNPITPLKSTVWETVLKDQWQLKRTISDIAKEVQLPENELHALVFRLDKNGLSAAPTQSGKPSLTVIT